MSKLMTVAMDAIKESAEKPAIAWTVGIIKWRLRVDECEWVVAYSAQLRMNDGFSAWKDCFTYKTATQARERARALATQYPFLTLDIE